MLPIPEITRSDMDGLPVFSIDGPRPFTAHLVFRVGIYDEALRDRGITHLVEHLALRLLKSTEIAFNGEVSTHLTTFTGQGHPDEVGAFLRSVCHALHNLEFEQLDVEARVLQREQAGKHYSYFDNIMWAYFGPRGPGVGAFEELGLRWLTEDRVREWVNSRFTLQNAALLVVGDAPTSFGLELPDGLPMHFQAPERLRPAPESPTLFDSQDTGVTWGTLIRHSKGNAEPAFFVGVDTVTRRLEDRLRHDLGQTYSVPYGWHRIDTEFMAASLGFDCEPAQSRECGVEHERVMSQFMESGPTQEELDRAVRAQRRAYEDHPLDAAQFHMFDEAEALLSGWGPTTSIAENQARLEGLTPEEVADRFREAYRQSYTIANLPSGVMADVAQIVTTSPTPLSGVQFVTRRQLRKDQAGLVRIGPDGISAGYSDGWINLEVDHIELVVTEPEGIRAFSKTRNDMFLSDGYVANPPSWRRGVQTGLVALLAIALAVALLRGAWLVALLSAIAATVLFIYRPPGGGRSSLIRERGLSMQEAVRKHIPPDRVLPEDHR